MKIVIFEILIYALILQIFTYGVRYSFEEDKIEWRTFGEKNEKLDKTKVLDKTNEKSDKTKKSNKRNKKLDKTKKSNKTNEDSDVSQHFKQCTVHLSAICNNQIAVVLSTKELLYMEVLKVTFSFLFFTVQFLIYFVYLHTDFNISIQRTCKE